jgi:hypothetical protein
MISLHNYANSKLSLSAITSILIFALLPRTRHVIESIKYRKLVTFGHRSFNFLGTVYKLDHLQTPAHSAVQIWAAELRILKKEAS